MRAFELFYECVAGMILGTLRVILRDPAHAEELTQEVLVELWCTAERYSPGEGTAITWTMTLAHRRAVDRLRQARASARQDTIATVDALHGRPFDPVADTVTVHENHRQLRHGLAQLTELQRESVLLAYYQGLTSREIGDALHIPAATVTTLIHHGLIRLRAWLGVPASPHRRDSDMRAQGAVAPTDPHGYVLAHEWVPRRRRDRARSGHPADQELRVRRIREVLHTIISTVVNVITLPFRALAKLFRPRP